MTKTAIPIELARRMAIQAQFFDQDPPLPPGKEGVAQIVERLGYVQIDTISVVERAHHHTLGTRCPDYEASMLHDLQAQERRVFEYWGHAASYLPMADYRFYIPLMRSFPRNQWETQRLEQHGHLMESVLDRIRQEGPLGSKDFKPPPGAKRGTWWDWKPAKVALELLFWQGDLMITERRKFQRIYDLTERVLPAAADTTPPDNEQLGRFLVRRALSAYGVAREREIRDHIHAAKKEVISQGLTDLVEAGQVIPLNIEPDGQADYFALLETIEQATTLRSVSSEVRFLCPFDNLIIQRERTRRLFGFDYSLECYVPAVKRKYGYFVFPILWGERLVGRLDPKADRKQKTLIIRNLVFEPWFAGPDFKQDEFLPAFMARLRQFAQFNRCETIKLEKVSPSKLKGPIEQLLSLI